MINLILNQNNQKDTLVNRSHQEKIMKGIQILNHYFQCVLLKTLMIAPWLILINLKFKIILTKTSKQIS